MVCVLSFHGLSVLNPFLFGAGGPQHTVFSSFSAAVFVAGGSGITFALSAIQDLVQKDLKGASRVKTIELIWIVPDPACLAPVLPTLSMLVQQSVFTPLRISVFYTRAPTGKQPAFFAEASASPFAVSALGESLSSPPYPPPCSAAAQSQALRQSISQALCVKPLNPSSPTHQSIYFPPGLTLAPGKPRLVKFLEHAITSTVTLGHSNPKDEALNLTGLIVGVCGPVGMVDEVAAAVSGLDPLRRDQVGGVELHEEVFGW
jgi:ferric-chelate reductase